MPSRPVAALLVCLAVAVAPAATAETERQPDAHHTDHDHRATSAASRTHKVHHRHGNEARRKDARRRITSHEKTTPPSPPVAVTPAPSRAAAIPKPLVGSSTGLPIPRFAALRADEVNMRAGPGTQYPIEWVFKHQDMPVEIEREFDVWRLVEAPDETKGWIHQATLIGSRTFFVPETGPSVALRRSSATDAPAVATLEPGVIGRLLRCDLASVWCRVSVHGVEGYVERLSIWGLLPNEVVGTTP